VRPTSTPTSASGSSTGGTYVVKPGETLASIAQAMGVTLQALIDTNNITDPDLVNAGVALRVPPGGRLP
jgi:lipoprotein NlpD